MHNSNENAISRSLAEATGGDDRSLSYLCRSFDQLVKGEDYSKSGAAIHIGFLNYTPFPDASEFYAKYKLLASNQSHANL